MKIEDKSSDTLAAIVVTYRKLGIDRDGAVEAMKELQRREERGDSFDYKEYIKKHSGKVPKSIFSNKDSLDILKTLRAISGTK